jgi:hypothetical protein
VQFHTDAYERCTNLGEKILLIVLPSMVEAENFSDHLRINDLPKIINKTSTPILFAVDTSILFAYSNLTDLNKNIHIAFTTLNKWLGANKLSLL